MRVFHQPAVNPPRPPLDLVGLTPLMALGEGSPALRVALIDGPVALGHPDLAGARLQPLGGGPAACASPTSDACAHGTFVAGVLAARRGARAPAICPGCSLLVRAIFSEAPPRGGAPTAGPRALAEAIVEAVEAGARLVNLSVGVTRPSTSADRDLDEALDLAARRGAIVVAAAGNQGTLGSSAITRHPWVIPVLAADAAGRVDSASTLSGAAGRNGLAAPGVAITGLSPSGAPVALGGTSVAAPFVTGAAALLWSLFPRASAAELRRALLGRRAPALIPPLLDAAAAHERLRRLTNDH